MLAQQLKNLGIFLLIENSIKIKVSLGDVYIYYAFNGQIDHAQKASNI